jgi:hypothetical protein
MHLPSKSSPDPIAAAAASRNRGARRAMVLLALLAACGTAEPPANGGTSGPPAGSGVLQPPANGGETLVSGADDGVWESLPIGARVRTGGYLGGAFEDGARVHLNPHVCAHVAMTRAEWDRLIQTVRPGQQVMVRGSKAPRPNGGCLIQLERALLVAR